MSDTPNDPFADPINADTAGDGTELSDLGGNQNSTAYLEARNRQLTDALTRSDAALTQSQRSVKTLTLVSGALVISSLFSAGLLIAASATSNDNGQSSSCVCPSVRSVVAPTISGEVPISTAGGIIWSRSEESASPATIPSSDDRGKAPETASISTLLTLYTPDGGSIKIMIPSETGVVAAT